MFFGLLHHQWFNKPKEECKENVGIPVNETEEGKLFLQLRNSGCPDCGSKMFAEGPSGGISTNIQCAECKSEFNITPWVQIAERIKRNPPKVPESNWIDVT